MGILNDLTLKLDIEVLARGLVVSFPEPMNGKAEAVLISNGIVLDEFTSEELKNEEITANTLVLTMEKGQKEKVLSHFKNGSIISFLFQMKIVQICHLIYFFFSFSTKVFTLSSKVSFILRFFRSQHHFHSLKNTAYTLTSTTSPFTIASILLIRNSCALRSYITT